MGGCVYGAAEAVCAASPDALQSLVDKSLLQRRIVEESEPRFWMLETIRQYAGGQLEEAGEAAELNDSHARFYAELAAVAELGMRTSAQPEWIRRLELERENLALAIGRSLAEGCSERGLELAASLCVFWEMRGPNEGRDWLNRGLIAADGRAPAKVHFALGQLGFFQGDSEGALASLRRAAELGRAEGDPDTLALTLSMLGWVLAEGGKHDPAAALLREVLELALELKDRWVRSEVANNAGCAFLQLNSIEAARPLLEEGLRLRRSVGNDVGVADSLLNLGYAELTDGRCEEARRLLDESVAISRAQGDGFRLALALGNLGTVALALDRAAEAERVLVECLQICAERGDRRVGSEALLVLAAALADQGDSLRALRLAAAAGTMYAGAVASQAVADATTARLDRARAALGEPRAAEAAAAGRDLTLEQALADLAGRAGRAD